MGGWLGQSMNRKREFGYSLSFLIRVIYRIWLAHHHRVRADLLAATHGSPFRVQYSLLRRSRSFFDICVGECYYLQSGLLLNPFNRCLFDL